MTRRKLSDELARATEAAAIAAHRHIGGHDLEAVDRAAVDAMRKVLNRCSWRSQIAIGEGEKDQAPMLHIGEALGATDGPLIDLAVDPIDGTRAAAAGKPGSVSALAAAPAGRMFRPGSVAYMEKLVGPGGADLHLDMPTEELVTVTAKAAGRQVGQLRVAILDRPRNASRAREVLAAGANVVALPFADLSACMAAASGTADIQLLVGIGGCAEGVIAAVGASALGASMQCRLWPRSESERHKAEEAGNSCTEIYDAESLVGKENLSVVLTGVTGSEIVDAISCAGSRLIVHSVRIDSGHAPVFTQHAID